MTFVIRAYTTIILEIGELIAFIMLLYFNEELIKLMPTYPITSATLIGLYGLTAIGTPVITFLPEIIEFFS